MRISKQYNIPIFTKCIDTKLNQHFEKNRYYEVKEIDIGQSSTHISLMDNIKIETNGYGITQEQFEFYHFKKDVGYKRIDIWKSGLFFNYGFRNENLYYTNDDEESIF